MALTLGVKLTELLFGPKKVAVIISDSKNKKSWKANIQRKYSLNENLINRGSHDTIFWSFLNL